MKIKIRQTQFLKRIGTLEIMLHEGTQAVWDEIE